MPQKQNHPLGMQTKTGQNQTGLNKADSDKTAQATMQAISVSQVTEQDNDYESENDHDPLDLDSLLKIESCN